MQSFGKDDRVLGVSESEFELRLSEKDQARVLFRTEKGRVSKFTIQLERKNKKWSPIVRFDTAHRKVHKHTFRPGGTQEITKLEFADYNQAFTYIYQYVRLHWKEMVAEFERKRK